MTAVLPGQEVLGDFGGDSFTKRGWTHDLFPKTRYQGSKRKLLRLICDAIAPLEFDTALDAFGGTAAVSYLFKTLGKQVTYNDILVANHVVGKALIENPATRVTDETAKSVMAVAPSRHYDDFIERTFEGIFFTRDENRWLDIVAQNLSTMQGRYGQAMSRFALYQACMAKRPYNLFHRANLYMRTAEVTRSFGNKSTWDKPFDELMIRALREANKAVFDNGRMNRALNEDVLNLEPVGYDLVYLDPPYVNGKGVGLDYLDFYHFLEGLTEYETWPDRISPKLKHKPYRRRPSPWIDPERIASALDEVFGHFKESLLVLSYRDNGIPSVDELRRLMKRHKRTVTEGLRKEHKYVLSPRESHEILLIGS